MKQFVPRVVNTAWKVLLVTEIRGAVAPRKDRIVELTYICCDPKVWSRETCNRDAFARWR